MRTCPVLVILVLAIGVPATLAVESNDNLIVYDTTNVAPSEPVIPITPSGQGEPAQYIFVGEGTGDIGGQPVSDAAFTIVLTGNTSEIYEHPSQAGIYLLVGPSTIDIDGFPTADFETVTLVFCNTNSNGLGFSSVVYADLVDVHDPVFADYMLDTSIGPIYQDDPCCPSQFTDVPTSLGLLSFDDIDYVRFEAIVGEDGDVPSVSRWGVSLTVALLLAASAAVMLWRRHMAA